MDEAIDREEIERIMRKERELIAARRELEAMRRARWDRITGMKYPAEPMKESVLLDW